MPLEISVEAIPVVGKRITLRPLSEVDIPLLIKWLNDPDITSHLDRWKSFTGKEARRWIESSRQRAFVIVTNEEECCIGITRLHEIHRRDKRANTTMVIGGKEYQSRGFGTEAKLLLLYYAFEIFGLHKIYGRLYRSNDQSLRYNKRCGYKIEGILKRHKFRHGQFQDLVCIAVFRKDWLSIWERYNEADSWGTFVHHT